MQVACRSRLPRARSLPHRRPRVCTRGGLLHVAQQHPGIGSGGDEGVSQRVRRDGLADPGAAGGRADDPPGAVPVQPPPVRGPEHRPAGALADGQVDRPGRPRRQRYRDDLAAPCGCSSASGARAPRPGCSTSAPAASQTRSPFSASSEISACPAGEPSPAAASSAPGSLRSSAAARDSQAIRGRRTRAAGERSRSSSRTAYLQNPPMADSRRVTAARARPLVPRSRAKPSMSARRTANRASERPRHQPANCRRPRAYASRVRPRYPARNPASATRPAPVTAG